MHPVEIVERELGQRREEHDAGSVQHDVDEEREAFGEFLAYVWKTRTASPQVGHWLTKHGRWRLIAWSNHPMAATDGAPASLLTTGIDLTDRAPPNQGLGGAPAGDPEAKLVEVGRLATEQRALRTNVRGTFVVDQQAARRLRPGGAIVNFSSSVVKLALPAYSAYAASKGAVDAITLILAKELRGRDITVNAVATGPTATPPFLDGKDQATVDHLAGMAPLERLETPEDIAEAVAFLAGPGRWVNGQTLYANGGVV